MPLSRTCSLLKHPLALAVVAVLLATLLLQGGTLPHSHDGVGLYNQEHDLTTLAAFGGGAPLPAVAPVMAIAVVLAQVIAPVAWRPVGACLRHADFRAPPVR